MGLSDSVVTQLRNRRLLCVTLARNWSRSELSDCLNSVALKMPPIIPGRLRTPLGRCGPTEHTNTGLTSPAKKPGRARQSPCCRYAHDLALMSPIGDNVGALDLLLASGRSRAGHQTNVGLASPGVVVTVLSYRTTLVGNPNWRFSSSNRGLSAAYAGTRRQTSSVVWNGIRGQEDLWA